MRGFSLVELMIVMVIISVLGAVAIPSYQDYVIRAKVTNLLTLAQPVKLAITEALLEGSEAKVDKISNLDIAKEISVASNVITIQGNSEKLGIKPSDRALKLTLTPANEQGLIAWKCAVEPGEFKKYVPSECRQAVASE